jgi:formate hydrogenlyase subunit 3/multisubunit Na+/H+ antiporter MnhD subunit
MFETSKDLLNIVIAISVLLLAGFLSWLIYYMAMMMREFFQVTQEMHSKVKKVDEAVKSFTDKIEHLASYILLAKEGIEKWTKTKNKKKGR